MATEVYADSFLVRTQRYAVTIGCGEVVPVPGAVPQVGQVKGAHQAKVELKVPPAAAKELAIVLTKHIKDLEQEGGVIPISAEWMAKIGIAPEDQDGWW